MPLMLLGEFCREQGGEPWAPSNLHTPSTGWERGLLEGAVRGGGRNTTHLEAVYVT